MKKLENLKIERVPVSSLSLHPHNARQGDVGAICQSLEAHGQYRALVVQKSTNTVIAGNHTLQAASTLGWKEVDVTFVDVDDEQALRILLVDNRSSDQATYDDTVLTDLLEHLAHLGDGLYGTGFDGDDLDDLIGVHEFTEPLPPKTTICPACAHEWDPRAKS
jgi:ParB-like chromosome segregation protein Spo0J